MSSKFQQCSEHVPILVRGRHNLLSLVWKTRNLFSTRAFTLELQCEGGVYQSKRPLTSFVGVLSDGARTSVWPGQKEVVERDWRRLLSSLVPTCTAILSMEMTLAAERISIPPRK